MIAIAVPNDGDRPWVSSLEIVEWSRPVRIAKVRWLMRRSAIASRSQPPKSPSVIRLGRSRSSTSRCPQPSIPGLGQREPSRRPWARPALHGQPRVPGDDMGRLSPRASVELPNSVRIARPVPRTVLGYARRALTSFRIDTAT